MGVSSTDKKDTTQDSKKVLPQEHTKVDEDIKKGNLKEMQEDDSEFIIGISKKSTIKQKGGKKDKPNKATEKTQNFLNLDISVIKQIKDIGLHAPSYKHEVNDFVALIVKKQKELESAALTASLEAPKKDVPKEGTGQTKKD